MKNDLHNLGTCYQGSRLDSYRCSQLHSRSDFCLVCISVYCFFVPFIPMCKTKSWKLWQSFPEGLLQPVKTNTRHRTKHLTKNKQKDSNVRPSTSLVLNSSPGVGDFNALDMWIKQYDTEVKRKFAQDSDYSCLALRQVSSLRW